MADKIGSQVPITYYFSEYAFKWNEPEYNKNWRIECWRTHCQRVDNCEINVKFEEFGFNLAAKKAEHTARPRRANNKCHEGKQRFEYFVVVFVLVSSLLA